jgi:hypothetical protein
MTDEATEKKLTTRRLNEMGLGFMHVRTFSGPR